MPPAVSTSALEEELLHLAAADVEQFKTVFKSARDQHVGEATRACMRHLAAQGLDEAGKRMQIWLLSRTVYLHLLLDTEFLPAEKAVLVARILRDANPHFVGDLQREIIVSKVTVSLERLDRVLRIFEEAVGDPGAFIPWLRGLTQHTDERVRSKAAKVLCGLRPNIATIERQLRSHDARVRANAVEALWPVRSHEAIRLFNSVLTDGSHRVVVNALVGLYRSGVKASYNKLLDLAKDPTPVVRCAAIWGMGFLADPQAISSLRILAKDPCADVSSKALAVLATFPGGLEEDAPTQEPAGSSEQVQEADAPSSSPDQCVPPKQDVRGKDRSRMYIPV